MFQYLVTSITGIWNVKFNNVHCVANLLAGLKPHQVCVHGIGICGGYASCEGIMVMGVCEGGIVYLHVRKVHWCLEYRS